MEAPLWARSETLREEREDVQVTEWEMHFPTLRQPGQRETCQMSEKTPKKLPEMRRVPVKESETRRGAWSQALWRRGRGQ